MAEAGSAPHADSGPPDGDDVPDLPEYSEEMLARSFARYEQGRAIHIDDERAWYFFYSARWERDSILGAWQRARMHCSSAAEVLLRGGAYAELPEKQRKALATRITSANTVAAVVRLARSDPRIAANPDIWDRDIYSLCTPGGVVDLRTGELREHRLQDYGTKMTSVTPAGDCPGFIKFLLRVCGGDHDLVGFLQRFFGLCLTGDTKDHALCFFYGTGANGKSTLTSVMQQVMGDYAMSAPPETFQEQRGERHPADIAMLRGARLVVAQETDDGRRWNTARIKALTGGDVIVARFMRGNFFTYTPQFKLVFAGNHKPGLRNVDEAIRRRMNLIPFSTTIPATERDPNLVERLVTQEGPGILAWAIRGCLEWQRCGLAAPEAIRAATESYLADEDIFSQWIEDACERSANSFTRTAELHRSYTAWAEAVGERFLGMKRFSQELEDRGFARAKHPRDRSRGFTGLLLKPHAHQQEILTEQ